MLTKFAVRYDVGMRDNQFSLRRLSLATAWFAAAAFVVGRLRVSHGDEAIGDAVRRGMLICLFALPPAITTLYGSRRANVIVGLIAAGYLGLMFFAGFF